jgi:hypothetical protein
LAAVLLCAAGCTTQDNATTNDDLGAGGGGGGGGGGAAGDMTMLVNGCPPWPNPLANPDGGDGSDTWASFAKPFFASYCTRCHSSTLTGPARNNAPDGYDWDVEATVIKYAPLIRDAVGVSNFMPPDMPQPSCDDRRRLVRWIDAGTP